MINGFIENEINYLVLFLNSSITFLLYLYLQNRFRGIDRVFLLFSLFLFFVYSGFGAAFEKVPLFYTFMYIIFILVYFFTFSFTQKIIVKHIKSDKIFYFRRLSFIFLFMYLFLTFLNAGYPSFNLIKLINPSAPVLEFDLTVSIKDNTFKNLLYYLLLFIQPFYLISIYKYRFSPFKSFLLYLLPLYFYYTLGGYVARSYLLPYLFMFFFTIYYYRIDLRKPLKIIVITSLLPLLIFSFYFAEWRLGHETSNISIIDIVSIIIFQETSFPLHYIELSNLVFETQILDFFKWLLMLPIPSFLKGSGYSIDVNNYFTTLITGTDIYTKGYFVLLPGPVLESYLIFGKYLFFLLPFFGGLITGFLYKLFNLTDDFLILKIYFIFMFMPLIARAGFFSAIPVAINGFLLFYLFILLLKINLNDKHFISKSIN